MPTVTASAATAASAPDDPEIQALIGLVYERQNRFEESAEAYERYMRRQHIPDVLATGCFQEAEISSATPGRSRTCDSSNGRATLRPGDSANITRGQDENAPAVSNEA